MSHYKGDETTGFQSPAQDYIEPVIDLAAILDLRPPRPAIPCASSARRCASAASALRTRLIVLDDAIQQRRKRRRVRS